MTAFGAAFPVPPFNLASLLPAAGRGRVPPGAASPAGAVARIRPVERDDRADGSSDESLMLDFLDGSREAFEQLVARYRVELHAFIYRFLNSAAAADDVFQETFLQVFQSGHTFDPARRFRPWLFTIAANKARDWHRRNRSRGQVSLDAPIGSDASNAPYVDLLAGDVDAPDQPAERSDESAAVKEVIDAMPLALREILLLSYFQRMSYAQIAEALHIPLGTVKSRLHAAVATFAERWRKRLAERDGAGRRDAGTDALPPMPGAPGRSDTRSPRESPGTES